MADTNLTIIQIVFNDNCKRGLILPIIPYESSWNTPFRAVLYLCGLMYCSMGVTIVSGYFMGAIEKITCKTRKVYISRTKNLEPEVIEVRIWNDTIANLTLMALGSSAPEILLAVLEIVKNRFKAGDLGPGTIVGSAAFNLLIITATCIVAIPNAEVRAIKMLKVFMVTSIFSLFAYIWLLVILDYISPNIVESWEAFVTLTFLPCLVLIAWWADRNFICCKTIYEVVKEPQIELGSTPEDDARIAQSKFFHKDGTVNKESLINFYQELRKFPDLSDSDAAILAATKLIDNQPHSRMWYRIGAVRGLSGSKKVQPVLRKQLRLVYDTVNGVPTLPNLGSIPEVLNPPQPGKAIVEFQAASYSVLENIGTFNVTLVRSGNMENTIRVRVESFDGTAKAGSDYIPVNEIVVFGPYSRTREVAVEIVDDNQWEPDEEFFLRLSIVDEDFERDDVALGRQSIMEIVILDDDEPGNIGFRKHGILVKESCGIATIEVERVDGADGDVSVQWKARNGSAISPRDFKADEGVLKFQHGEALKILEIPIVDNATTDKDICFELELMNPEGGAKLGRITKIAVTITNDEAFHAVFQRMMLLTNHNLKEMEVTHGTWKSQIQDALTVNGGNVDDATNLDYFMHLFTFFWKVLFSLIPPAGMYGGWLCFGTSLLMIGVLTAFIGDLASIFGCLVGLEDTITAITFVSIGTSLPDLFASKVAAIKEQYADNAVGNVTGSNSVNVFLGLGLPWLVAALYHEQVLGIPFAVPSGTLGFSVFIYSTVAFITTVFLYTRRQFKIFGKAELGGPTRTKWMSGLFLVFMWLVYIFLSIFKAYNVI